MTTQNEVDSSKQADQELLEHLLTQGKGEAEPQAKFIDLDAPNSPAVLSGLFSVAVPMIYQYRQDGKLPASGDATTRDCIRHHFGYWKTKAGGKSVGLQEQKLVQDLELNRAKTESEWLRIKEKRGILIDKEQLALVFEPAFLQVRTQLLGIARRNPSTQDDIDKTLDQWDKMGKQQLEKSTEEFEAFIAKEMESEHELEKNS